MRWLWASALGLALTACGGGGGGDSGDSGGGATPTQPGTGTPSGVNGSLNGLVTYSTAEGAFLLDLENGGRAAFFPSPLAFVSSIEGRELAAIDTSTRAATGNDKIVLTALAGTVVDVTVPRSLSGLPRLSPDRQRIAARWANTAGGETTPMLTVFNRQGQVVARHSTAGAFNWMPNGRLLMAQDRQLVTANADGTSPSTVTTLAAAPLDVAVNRDGTRIALTLPGAAGTSHVWVMDASGANLRQLTTSSSNEMDAAWSADGQWLFVRQGVTNAAGSCPLAYAVPLSAAGTVTLGGADASPAIRLRTKNSAGATADLCATSPIGFWVR